jgi:beta-lactamase class A
MNDLCDQQEFKTHWYYKDLRTGFTADRDGAAVVPSASTRKIAVLAAAMQAVHEGRFTLDQPVEIQAKYQDNDSGTFQHLTPGFKITFRDALVMMIIVSDNTCTGMVVDMVGLDRINAISKAAGMVGTAHRFNIPPRLGWDHDVNANNATTATDVGVLLEALLDGSRSEAAAAKLGSTPALCQLALDILSWQKLKARLPSLLPQGTKVAHKTGTGARNFNDCGIVYVQSENGRDEASFILSAYTDWVPKELSNGTPGFAAANETIGKLARMCYDAAVASRAPVAAGARG